MAIITGTDGDDRYPGELEGTSAADKILGLAGNDVLIGFAGNDELEGGAGADELFGSEGIDFASYRSSNVGVYVSLNDLVGQYGHAEGDRLSGVEGAVGSAFKDSFYGSEGRDIFYGEGGNDQIAGQLGDDEVHGGAGNDLLSAAFGNDDIYGDAGNDTVSFFNYGSGVVADLASGTASGSEVGNDRLFTVENLEGTPYTDQLKGNGGANILDGHYGADMLTGRGGADKFLYEQDGESTASATDHIVDFSRSQGDKVHLADIDANQQSNGNQAFKFVGQGPLTGAGQLRAYEQNGDTIVEGDTSWATEGPELRIVLDTPLVAKATDFVL